MRDGAKIATRSPKEPLSGAEAQRDVKAGEMHIGSKQLSQRCERAGTWSNKFRKKHGDSTVVADPMILVSSRKMSVSMVVMKNNSRSYAHKETQDVWDPGQIKCFVELRQGSRVKTIHGTEELRLCLADKNQLSVPTLVSTTMKSEMMFEADLMVKHQIMELPTEKSSSTPLSSDPYTLKADTGVMGCGNRDVHIQLFVTEFATLLLALELLSAVFKADFISRINMYIISLINTKDLLGDVSVVGDGRWTLNLTGDWFHSPRPPDMYLSEHYGSWRILSKERDILLNLVDKEVVLNQRVLRSPQMGFKWASEGK
ncbi:hypothetical protein F2Q69_00055598 [Brassica cretica]|uniref:Uncharacterized protein n=1 Tax=Brassica cretica TaxID=69181 RepID=A0A8S9MT42_BRACR|nr:hypothetical protein F2Q69_00055598 [Brassica cretica]